MRRRRPHDEAVKIDAVVAAVAHQLRQRHPDPPMLVQVAAEPVVAISTVHPHALLQALRDEVLLMMLFSQGGGSVPTQFGLQQPARRHAEAVGFLHQLARAGGCSVRAAKKRPKSSTVIFPRRRINHPLPEHVNIKWPSSASSIPSSLLHISQTRDHLPVHAVDQVALL